MEVSRPLRRGPRWFDVVAGLWSALAAQGRNLASGRASKMTAHKPSGTAAPPSEDKPDMGAVGVGDAVLTLAEHFVLDGVHTIRSTEFDVSAHADSFDVAVAMFVDNAEDYCSYLAELAGQGKTTGVELGALGLLVPRILAVRRERERELEEMTDELVPNLLRRLRRKSPPTPTWRPKTTPAIYNEPSND